MLSRCQARATPGRYSFRVVGPLPALADFSVSPTTSKMSSCTERRANRGSVTIQLRQRRTSASPALSAQAHRGADQRARFYGGVSAPAPQINALAFLPDPAIGRRTCRLRRWRSPVRKPSPADRAGRQAFRHRRDRKRQRLQRIAGGIALASPNLMWQVGWPRRRSSSSIAGGSSWISGRRECIPPPPPARRVGQRHAEHLAGGVHRERRRRLPPSKAP